MTLKTGQKFSKSQVLKKDLRARPCKTFDIHSTAHIELAVFKR